MIISPRRLLRDDPCKWKPFIHHVVRARDHCSIAEIGLVAGGKERKEGRQTILFTPLDPFNSDADEAESMTDTTNPRKVQCQIHWRPEQDAVYWIHLFRETAHTSRSTKSDTQTIKGSYEIQYCKHASGNRA